MALNPVFPSLPLPLPLLLLLLLRTLYYVSISLLYTSTDQQETFVSIFKMYFIRIQSCVFSDLSNCTNTIPVLKSSFLSVFRES